MQKEPIYDADAAWTGDLSVYDDEAGTIYAGGLSERTGARRREAGRVSKVVGVRPDAQLEIQRTVAGALFSILLK